MQLIKGESSFWINNKSALLKEKFAWQDDYWMVGVSESHVKNLREYIGLQELHHTKKSFQDEMDVFMKKYGWAYVKE